jgi:hypothetical protein
MSVKNYLHNAQLLYNAMVGEKYTVLAKNTLNNKLFVVQIISHSNVNKVLSSLDRREYLNLEICLMKMTMKPMLS